MVSKFSGSNVVKRCLKVLKVSPRTCRILAFFYAVLSLAGSLMLLKYRKDWVEEYNRKDLIAEENTLAIVFIFGLFWLMSNGFLLYGVLLENVRGKRIHLYFLAGILIGTVAILLALSAVTLFVMVRVLDKAQTPWTEMVTQSLNFVLGVIVVALVIAHLFMFLCLLPVHYILIGGIESGKPICEEELNEDETLKNAEELKIAEELEKNELLEEVKCND